MRTVNLRFCGMKTIQPIAALVLLSLAACASVDQATSVDISLTNAGTEPIACRLIYGHWVERDLGELAPGQAVRFPVEQQAGDGALFTMRPDGNMRMMIETIQCGIYPDWMASVGQVDLAPARRMPVSAIAASCGRPLDGGRIACPPVTLSKAAEN